MLFCWPACARRRAFSRDGAHTWHALLYYTGGMHKQFLRRLQQKRDRQIDRGERERERERKRERERERKKDRKKERETVLFKQRYVPVPVAPVCYILCVWAMALKGAQMNLASVWGGHRSEVPFLNRPHDFRGWLGAPTWRLRGLGKYLQLGL